jgi:hypothetical protein
MRAALTPCFALLVTACASTGAAEPEYQEREAVAGYVCDASGLQDHIGHKASAKSGAILLELSGARHLRWVPPRTAVTMDYRQDRLTVGYDDDMVITRISCG